MRKIERRAHRKSAVNIYTSRQTHTQRRIVASLTYRLPDERYNTNSAHPCYNIVCVNERLFDRCVCGKVQLNKTTKIKRKSRRRMKEKNKTKHTHLFSLFFSLLLLILAFILFYWQARGTKICSTSFLMTKNRFVFIFSMLCNSNFKYPL